MRGGRGALLVTGHLGNWELGGSYFAARGVPVDAIARHMSNRVFERYLTRVRERFGVTVVFDEQAVRQTPRSSARRIAMSASCRPGRARSRVDASCRSSADSPRLRAVRRCLRSACEVPVRVRRRRARSHRGSIRLIVEPIAYVDTGDREADTIALVARYTARLEYWVRQYPGQYFWQHRRWKYQPDRTRRRCRKGCERTCTRGAADRECDRQCVQRDARATRVLCLVPCSCLRTSCRAVAAPLLSSYDPTAIDLAQQLLRAIGTPLAGHRHSGP